MRSLAAVMLLGVVAGSAAAGERDDQERALQQFFEGRRVMVLLDMPATSKGIDVHVADVEPINPSKVGDRIRDHGVSLRDGSYAPVTKIHVKDDMIEFQLAGGGFNWFWNTSTVSPRSVPKSRREKDLEREIDRETDSKRRRDLERDLERERRYREEDERRERDRADRENEMRREQDYRRAATAGSRFNLRWNKRIPPGGATPRGVMQALSRWVDFGSLPGAEDFRPRREDRRADRDDGRYDDDRRGEGEVRLGMSWKEVKEILGSPDDRQTLREGDLTRVIATYGEGRRALEVTFVNDIVVRVRNVDGGDRD
jgi:hypothetical protein